MEFKSEFVNVFDLQIKPMYNNLCIYSIQYTCSLCLVDIYSECSSLYYMYIHVQYSLRYIQCTFGVALALNRFQTW